MRQWEAGSAAIGVQWAALGGILCTSLTPVLPVTADLAFQISSVPCCKSTCPSALSGLADDRFRRYAERCPERFSPGAFDYVGASHQLFHVAILLAATAHYCCIAESFRYWHGEMGGQCTGPFAG